MRSLLFALALLFSSLIASSQGLYDKKNSEKFAEYLFKSAQYSLAAIEYERLLFLEPGNDELRTRLILCYSLENEHNKAIERVKLFSVEPSELSKSLAELYSYNLISLGSTDAARAYLTISNSLSNDRKVYYQAYSYLLENNFESSSNLMIQHPDVLDKSVVELINEGKNIKRKSPALAALMSAVVPGTGKFYTRDWKDAIIGLVTVGVTGYQAYRGFARNGIESGYGWIYGSLAAGFYIGNIYGSFTSAKRFNNRQTDKIAKKIQQSFVINP